MRQNPLSVHASRLATGYVNPACLSSAGRTQKSTEAKDWSEIHDGMAEEFLDRTQGVLAIRSPIPFRDVVAFSFSFISPIEHFCKDLKTLIVWPVLDDQGPAVLCSSRISGSAPLGVDDIHQPPRGNSDQAWNSPDPDAKQMYWHCTEFAGVHLCPSDRQRPPCFPLEGLCPNSPHATAGTLPSDYHHWRYHQRAAV